MRLSMRRSLSAECLQTRNLCVVMPNKLEHQSISPEDLIDFDQFGIGDISLAIFN